VIGPAFETTISGSGPASAPATPAFDAVYATEFAFVWRNLRRLGVGEAALRDAAQDVFVVVHRRLGEFEGRAPLRSWIYSIVTRIARQYRRTRERKELREVEDPEQVPDPNVATPEDSAGRGEALRLLMSLLEALDDDKREAIVLCDLEDMTVPEVAAAVGSNVNTVYSRVRAGRQQLRELLAQHNARAARKP
jgi:RNA polymerase sigma-70 factor (ECF subfamily)